jgi:hypothetical protein
MPLKCHYFSASSLSTLMHLPDFRMSLKIQPRQKSGSCIHNHSWTAISTSSLTLNQRHLCAALIFQKKFLLSCCVHINLWRAGLACVINTKGVHPTVFKLSPPLSHRLHFNYTIIIHLYQLTMNLNGRKPVPPIKLHHTTKFFLVPSFQCNCHWTSTYFLTNWVLCNLLHFTPNVIATSWQKIKCLMNMPLKIK